MKRSEIKIGETYGVRLRGSDHATVVPAVVEAIDEHYPYRIGRYGSETRECLSGGVRVRFVKPVRATSNDFSLRVDDDSALAGELIETYVFGDKRNGGSAGKCFVGVWSEMQKQKRDSDRAEREAAAAQQRRADEFEPVLDAYRKRLKKIGLKTEVHTDGSGVHGDVSISLHTTGYDYKRNQPSRPTSFKAFNRVEVSKAVFDQLVEIAERHGEKVKGAV